MRYKQCELRRGASRTVGWIPAWAAIVGNAIQLFDSEEHGHFWSVSSVGAVEIDGEILQPQEGCLQMNDIFDTIGNWTNGQTMNSIRPMLKDQPR